MSGQRQAVRPASSSSRRNNRSTSSNTGLASSTSRTSTSQAQGDPERHTVVIVSPPRRRRRTKETSVSVVKKKDLDVWDLPDEEIIDAAVKTWKSPVYSHYNVSIRRDLDDDDSPETMVYVFTCKTDPDTHKPHCRPREKTSEGTANLKLGAEKCNERNGVTTESSSSASTAPTYSVAAHRALIALRCAKHQRSFNSILDDDYQMEVEMLRPGTTIPHPITVSRDIHAIYIEMAKRVRDYFKRRNNTIHLVMDGWTAPIVASFLGIVVVWYEEGKIHRAILEFIRLTQKHDGAYLAQVTADCLRRFGLEKFLLTLCMDNASNCDGIAKHLPALLPLFKGMLWRTRCFPHIVNLIAKIFISFFFKRPKRKKKVIIAAGSKRKRGHQRHVPAATSHVEQEVVLQDGESEPEDESNAAAIEEEEQINPDEDDGREAHDEAVLKTVRGQAIRLMKDKGVVIADAEEKMALQLFPRVAGLARRVHDSTTLQEKFEKLVEDDTELNGSKKTLDRRVATRWNSDLTCLDAHVYLKNPVQQLTAAAVNKLQKYRLTDQQWDLADDLVDVLAIFEGPTKLFSKAEVPLVADTIPMLEDLEQCMVAVRDQVKGRLPNSIRVAAQASLLLIDKYFSFTDDCEVYQIAIVMSPDRKLQWFRERGRTSAQIEEIRKTVVNRWNETYKGSSDSSAAAQTVASAEYQPRQRRSKWVTSAEDARVRPIDDIHTYLDDPVVPADTIREAGGIMNYWHQAAGLRLRLSKFGSDYCSAPASSVDAERSFSRGRLQVGHLQHNMSSQTFKAQMAVGSWALTPLFTGLSDITTIIEKSRNKEDLKDGGHENGSESEADDELDVEMLTSEP